MLYLLTRAFYRLSHNFGNLNSLQSWQSFYKHLSDKASWSKPPVIKNPPTEDIVCLTTLLFQALTPVRAAFTDGQARIVSIAHFLRNVIPCGREVEWCIDLLSKCDPTTSLKYAPSSICEKTGSPSTFVVCTTENRISLEDKADVGNLLYDLQKVGQSRCMEASGSEKLYIPDLILNLIKHPKMATQSTDNLTNQIVEDHLKGILSEIIEKLMYLIPTNARAERDFTRVKEHIIGKSLHVAKFNTTQTNTSKMKSLHVLTYFLCGLIADSESRDLLSDLIVNGWNAPTINDEDSIHERCAGKIIRETSPSSSLYQELIRVRTMKSCCVVWKLSK